MGKEINVMVVDDSVFMRKIISTIVNSEPGVTVATTAKNGKEALDLLKTTDIDVITLDINMPEMDGITALKHIMATKPTPVIMISALTQEGAKETFDALEIGAIDYVAKPSGSISFDIDKQRDEIISKIKNAAGSKLRRRAPMKPIPQKNTTPAKSYTGSVHSQLSKKGDVVVAIGASTGGPTTLFEVIPKLPADLNAPVFIIQHMPALFTKTFAKRLNDASSITVKEAEDNEFIEKSKVYIAKGSSQLIINKEKGTNKRVLNIDTKTNTIYKPNVNLTFNSLVETYSPNIIGVVLTGMGDDGATGIANIKKSGGVTIAEDESTAVIFGMPREAIKTGSVDHVLRADKVAEEIIRLVNEKA